MDDKTIMVSRGRDSSIQRRKWRAGAILVTFLSLTASSQDALAQSRLKQCLRSVLQSLTAWKGPSKDDYTWGNGELSDAQWRNLVKFAKRVKKMPSPGASIDVRPQSHFDDSPSLHTPIGVQKIRRNGAYENAVLARSGIDTHPKEVLNFRLHLYDGRILETPIWVTGNARTVDFSEGEFELFQHVGGDMGAVKAVEVTHSHPSYEVVIADDGGRRTRSNEISAEDMQMMREFAQRIPSGKKVIIRAVVPNGYTYEMSLRTGRR